MENYEKLKTIGRGAHGTVSLCVRISDGHRVVIKEIPVELKTKTERQAALGEAKTLQMFNFPFIIGYYEYFFDDNNLCIVMEYGEGGTLAEYLNERKGCLIDEDKVLHFCAQIVLSLYHLHSRQVLHRDLKTQNILLNKARTVCKLSDFGISKILSTTKSEATTVLGTPSYMSPEILEGKKYNHKSDLWSLGCVLYELTTLKRAFEAETVGAVVMKIMRGQISEIAACYTEELRYLIIKLLERDPFKRPTIAEVMAMPVLIGPILRVMTDMGAIPCSRPRPLNTSKNQKLRSSIGSRHKHAVQSPAVINMDSAHTGVNSPFAILKNECLVYTWGDGVEKPLLLPLPMANSQITQVACGAYEKFALTQDGEMISWEEKETENDDATYMALESNNWSASTLCGKFIKHTTPVTIAQIACGDLFYALVTDKGILMTCGSGQTGCLGHGNIADCPQPKIVQALVDRCVVRVACGTSHILACTDDNDLYGWGKPDNGRLGIGSRELQCKPHRVILPENISIHSLYCGLDASAVVCKEGILYSTGNNKYNKLGLWADEAKSEQMKIVWQFMKCCSLVPPIDVKQPQPFSLGLHHTALISDGKVYTFGSNQAGQLGPRDEGSSNWWPSLVQVPDDSPCNRVQCGDFFTIVATQSHNLYSWGKPTAGKLGRPGPSGEAGQIRLATVPHNGAFPFSAGGRNDKMLRVEILSLSCFNGCTAVGVKTI